MQNELPKAYDPALIEEKWAKFWVEERLFDVPTPPSGHAANPFVQLLPPPNVTGRLHMGHMLNQTEMDILTRWHRMLGETAVWVPGTDHAGIATQMMVERQLTAEGKKRTGGAITEQMRRLGASVDWSREYFTMDDRLSVAVKEAFVRLYEQGLIYRGAYIVNWDPILGTAVSDLEVESEERAGHLYHIRYPLADGSGSVTIATTRPETMLGDVAVAVNPSDERYKHLVGKNLTLPLTGREIPIVADDWANPEFGTGAVKVTPAHDPNDFALGQRHNLPQPSIMDEQARISLAGSPYDGLDRFEARKRIVADLEAAGLLVAVKDHALTLPISQRTGAVIEPRLSMQWFIAVNKAPNTGGNSIAANAIAAVRDGHIKFTPEMYSKTYFEWMNNLHDWCISRQLWWGHRIPAWHCGACGKITVTLAPTPACQGCGITDIKQETDVLDTWFSSGLLPFTVFGWNGSNELTPDLAAFYPTQLLVTGFDILFFWVARMIMLGCHFMLDVPMPDGGKRSLKDAVPFREVYIHSLVRDANREKMSKTKGNVIDPIEIITRYGTDAVRFTLASQASPGTDIAFNEARTEGYRAFANKIWNAARFLQMNIERAKEAGYTATLNTSSVILSAAEPRGGSAQSKDPEGAQPATAANTFSTSNVPLETRWIFSRLSAVSTEVAKSLKEYRFDEASQAIYQFFWGEFCDYYLELVKIHFDFTRHRNANDDAATKTTLNALVTVFEAALRLLSPFMPFLTEELWHALYNSIGAQAPMRSIALTRYPQGQDFHHDGQADYEMETLQGFITLARSCRKQAGVPEKDFIKFEVVTLETVEELLLENMDMVSKQIRSEKVIFVDVLPQEANVLSSAGVDIKAIYERQIDVPAERERLTKELAKLNKGLEAAEKQLGNGGFIARAPANIVEGLKKQHAETLALRDKAQSSLDSLPVA